MRRILIDKLLAIGIIKHGNFILKSGMESSVYFDFRILNSYPSLWNYIAQLATPVINKIQLANPGKTLRLLGIPMGAIPLASILSQYFAIPSLLLRTTPKKHGLGKILEGEYNDGDVIILVDDVFTAGTSLGETIEFIKNHVSTNFDLSNVLIVLDRSSGLAIQKYPNIQSIFQVEEFETTSSIMTFPIFQNSIANKLYQIAIAKKSNIIVSADYSYSRQITKLIQEIGHLVAGVKLHIDIIHNTDPSFIEELKFLKAKYNLILIEDIKAGDLSEITLAKLRNPRNGILEWADAITIHPISGIPKLGDLDLGLIPVVEMSCNSLINPEYTRRSLDMMRETDNANAIAGCVIQSTSNMTHKWEFLGLTPGINFDTVVSDSSSSQKYRNPLDSYNAGQFWIIGRGITLQEDKLSVAEKYRNIGWQYFVNY